MLSKPQIHAGGRGKGGGVKIANNREEAISVSKEILGMTLITPQTTDKGQLVRKVLLTEAVSIEKEFYLSITLDRSKKRDVLMISSEGGVDIEEVATKTPEKIIRSYVDPALGLMTFQVRRICSSLDFQSKELFKKMTSLLNNLYRCYRDTDASIVEINPLIVTKK